MKKAVLFILLVDTATAQLNLERGSYLTLQHAAVGDQFQFDDQFGARFGTALDPINDDSDRIREGGIV
ncbi:MAG: hypothetical protein AB8B80_05290 [Marinicellaceae bacterium]